MADSLFPSNVALKTLKRYYRERLTVVDFDDLLLRIQKETDRAKIILLSTILEDLLENRLANCVKASLSPGKMEHLFRFEGPLGTFSSRIEIGYAFAFIEPEIAKQLNVIREMRNACAHSKYELSFERSELRNVAKGMFKPIGLFYPNSENAQDFRHAFLAEMPPLFYTLTDGSRSAAITRLRAEHGAVLFP